MSNFFVQELVLYRHFMLIDSPIPFELVANPTNYRKDERGNVLNVDMSEITGRDICSRPAGAWRIDCWTLLPEQYHKQNPVFTMLIKYDRDLLAEGEKVDIRYSDIDIGEGVAGVNGQLVDIPASAFRPVVNAIATASASLADKFDEQNVFLSEVNATTGSISDDVSTIRSDVVDISGDVDSIKAKVSDIVDVQNVRYLGGLGSWVEIPFSSAIYELSDSACYRLEIFDDGNLIRTFIIKSSGKTPIEMSFHYGRHLLEHIFCLGGLIAKFSGTAMRFDGIHENWFYNEGSDTDFGTVNFKMFALR